MSIPIHARRSSLDEPWRLGALVAAAGCIALLLWAVAATGIAMRRARQVGQLESQLVSLTHAANAAKLEMINNQQLHRVFGNLRKYDPHSMNPLGVGCLECFDIHNDTIAVFVRNNSRKPISANFEIRFLNEFGFVTETFRSSQSAEMVEPGRTCVCEGVLTFRHGEPVYYAVEMLE